MSERQRKRDAGEPKATASKSCETPRKRARDRRIANMHMHDTPRSFRAERAWCRTLSRAVLPSECNTIGYRSYISAPEVTRRPGDVESGSRALINRHAAQTNQSKAEGKKGPGKTPSQQHLHGRVVIVHTPVSRAARRESREAKRTKDCSGVWCTSPAAEQEGAETGSSRLAGLGRACTQLATGSTRAQKEAVVENEERRAGRGEWQVVARCRKEGMTPLSQPTRN